MYNKVQEFHTFVEQEEVDIVLMSESWEREEKTLLKGNNSFRTSYYNIKCISEKRKGWETGHNCEQKQIYSAEPNQHSYKHKVGGRSCLVLADTKKLNSKQ